MRGNCYAAAEAAYHILGGKAAGWKPMVMHTKNDTHWFLRHESGMILDLSRRQFKGKLPDYSLARGSGFLTKQPSRRAAELMHRMTYR